MKKKNLSLAFIGGSIDSAVGYAHFSACKMDSRWSIDAGCFSRDDDENNRSAKAYNVSLDRIYTSWEDMLKKEKSLIDAVVVLTPTPMHFEIVKKCLDMSIPVICEKALSTDSATAYKLDELCKQKKGFLAVTYNYTGYPMVRELKSLIEKKELGNILHFKAEMPQEGFVRLDKKGNKPSPQNWRLSDGKIPTIHLDLATHLHQMIYYLTGAHPEKVISSQSSDGWFNQIIDNVDCLCNYSDNIKGKIWFSKSALGHRNGMEINIYGSKASAHWVQAFPEELTISYADGTKKIIDRASDVSIADKTRYTRFKAGHPAGFIEAFANLYYDIADCLNEYLETGKYRSSEVFGAALAADGLKFLEAMVKSTGSGKWETISK